MGPVTRYPGLDGIRAIAAIGVVATHAAYWTGRYGPDTGGLFLARLDFGVALFFVLSGFLLFRPWLLAARADADGPSVRRYLWHRALRILPAYWVVVLVAFALVPSVDGTGPQGLLRSLTLTQIYGDDQQRTGLTQMWSLATEVVFYLLLPVFGWLLVAVLAGRRWRPLRILAGCAALGGLTVVWYVATRTVVTFDISSVFWLPNYLDWFAAGMALAVLAVWWETDRERSPAVLRTVAAAPGSCWVLAGCLIAVAATPVAGAATLVPLPLGEALTKNLLYLAAALALIAPCVLRPELTAGTRWVGGPAMRWLGAISYEIFLVHIVVLEGVMRVLDLETFTGSALQVFVLTLAVSVPLAWLLYRTVERPVRRLRDRVGSARPEPRPVRP
jgi:peptidoglycan/LPS O-acetylase OafA/YrhL